MLTQSQGQEFVKPRRREMTVYPVDRRRLARQPLLFVASGSLLLWSLIIAVVTRFT